MKIGIVLETRSEDAQHSKFAMALVALEAHFLGTILATSTITFHAPITIAKN